jgi:mono/diheme cytochrome c family protein
VQLLRLFLMLAALLPGAAALAADNGKRLAEMWCATCHIVSPDQRREISNAPPFDVIGRKFASSPETLAFAILDPHPRMSVTLTRPEALDIAAYISSLAR